MIVSQSHKTIRVSMELYEHLADMKVQALEMQDRVEELDDQEFNKLFTLKTFLEGYGIDIDRLVELYST